MINQEKLNHKGFTLIEVMLALLVMAAIALFAVKYIQDRNVKKNIDLTIQQVEHLLQIAVSYSSRENEWPNNINDLKPDFIKDMDLCSPWPGSSTNKQCTGKEVYKMASFPSGKNNKTSGYYGISIKLPNLNLAEQIEALLSNSARSGNTVTGYVLSGQTTPAEVEGKGWINSAGAAEQGTRIDMPFCDEGFEGHVIFSPLLMTTDTKKIGVFRINNMNVNIGFTADNWAAGTNDSIVDKNGDDPYIQVQHNMFMQENAWVRNAYFLTFCVANGNWDMRITNDRYGPRPTQDDGQCSSNWRKYNDGSGVRNCGQANI